MDDRIFEEVHIDIHKPVELEDLGRVLIAISNLYNFGVLAAEPALDWRTGTSESPARGLSVLAERQRAASAARRQHGELLVVELRPGSVKLVLAGLRTALDVASLTLATIGRLGPDVDRDLAALELHDELIARGVTRGGAQRYVERVAPDLGRLLRASRHGMELRARRHREPEAED